MVAIFIGRDEELAYLNSCYAAESFQFVVVYGRRRIGKTMLLSEFAKEKRAIYHMAEEASQHLQIEALSHSVLASLGKPSYLKALEDYDQIFEYLAASCGDDRLLLIIDEFPYLAASDKGLISKLQKWIDTRFRDTKLMLVLCGSSISFMEDKVMAHKSPLYGRRTGQMEIKPFDFFEARKFIPGYTIVDQVKVYGIVGGMPLYLDLWDDSTSLQANAERLLLSAFSVLYEEPQYILKQELREPMLYASIISAIANGASRLNDIATKIGESMAKTSVYLKTLVLLRLIRKVKPAFEKEHPRKTLYVLDDQLFKFAYRFVYPHRLLIEQQQASHLFLERVEPFLNEFCGDVFEAICMQYLMKRSKSGTLGFYIETIGKWWGNDPVSRQEAEVDIIAAGSNVAIAAECKFRNEKQGIQVLDTLKHRCTLLRASQSFEYWIFSKSGFTESLISAAENDPNVTLVTIEDMAQ